MLDHDHFLLGPATVYLEPRRAGDARVGAAVPEVMADPAPRRSLAGLDHAQPRRAGSEAERVVPGGCHICFNSCTVDYHLRDGRVSNVFGNSADPVFEGRVCPKSQMTLQLYDHPDRLMHPLRRTRGGALQRVSWASALDEIAERLQGVRDRYGSEALAVQAGTRTGVLNIMGFMRMFSRLWGTPNVATTEPFCDAGKVVSLELTLGSTNLPNVYTRDDIGSAALHVFIGDNAAETRPVNFGLLQGWRIERGARMIVVDPRLTPTAAKADRWLAIRPGADMALGLALAHEILSRGWHDAAFCERFVLGFDAWRDFIAAEGYTPEWAAHVTAIDAATIRELARDIAQADGCMLFASRGVNQHSNSAQANRVFLFLAAITGNVGRRGGGYFNVAAEPDWQPVPLPASRVPGPLRPAVSKNPALWPDAMITSAPYAIRAMITGNNPLAQWPGQAVAREALRGLDLLVHMDLFHNETSAVADFVLPASTGVEKGGVSRLAEDRRIVWNERLIDPPGEAQSDHWFWIELGKRFGYDDVLRDEYKDPARFYDEVFRHATPDLTGASIARLRATPHRWLRTPLASEDAPEPDTLYLEGSTAFGQPRGKRFPTPSGRLEFHSDALEEKFAAVGLSALPAFYSEDAQLIDLPHLARDADAPAVPSPFFGGTALVQPARIAPGSEATRGPRLRAAGFDTELVTGRPAAPHFHSWTHYFWQAQEMWPELYCQLHPAKAASLGVRDGDRVRIESEGHSIDARAWVTPGIRESAVFVPIGWGERQPYHPAKPVNWLVGRQLDPVSQQTNLKLHLCRVVRLGPSR